MSNEAIRIALICTLILFFSFGYLFRARVSYIFCPLEKYSGKIGRSKTSYFLLAHFNISLGLAFACYTLLGRFETLNTIFRDSFARVTSIILIWFVWIIIFGLIIEVFLEKTDGEYRTWKKGEV